MWPQRRQSCCWHSVILKLVKYVLNQFKWKINSTFIDFDLFSGLFASFELGWLELYICITEVVRPFFSKLHRFVPVFHLIGRPCKAKVHDKYKKILWKQSVLMGGDIHIILGCYREKIVLPFTFISSSSFSFGYWNSE